MDDILATARIHHIARLRLRTLSGRRHADQREPLVPAILNRNAPHSRHHADETTGLASTCMHSGCFVALPVTPSAAGGALRAACLRARPSSMVRSVARSLSSDDARRDVDRRRSGLPKGEERLRWTQRSDLSGYGPVCEGSREAGPRLRRGPARASVVRDPPCSRPR